MNKSDVKKLSEEVFNALECVDKEDQKGFFEALMVMLVWVLIGVLTINFAKFLLFLIGAFLVISLVIWFKDRMNK